jgi:microcystin-dependent protein
MDPFIGQIDLFPFGFAPMGWTECNGATLQINQNQALFALIGTTYGGNGTSNFCIPDLRNASPTPAIPNMRYYIALQGIFPPRN